MRKPVFFFFGCVLSYAVQAEPVEFVGYKSITISTSPNTHNKNQITPKTKTISVQKISLSPEAKLALKDRIDELQVNAGQQSRDKTLAPVPSIVNLGMNGTPVLDQGQHGSCVTFALTGTLNAIIGKGNYISQLCSLELGSYLVSIKKIKYSGWNGSWGSVVLNQLNTYGIFPLSIQVTSGCAGVKQYPLNNAKDTGKPMTISQYMAYSKPLSNYASWIVLADPNSAFTSNFNPTTLLNNVKSQLRSGRRISFGMLLDDTQGDAGALGTSKKRYDSWVLTPSITAKAKKGLLNAGHELIIIGYNDAAIARTADGKISTGMLILRNSWGPYVGDGGNYYMSYEYFKALADEAYAIVPKK